MGNRLRRCSGIRRGPALAGSKASRPVTGKIVYTSLKDGQADIYSMNANGKNVVNLTHDKTIGVRADVQPVWAPGGDFVAFEPVPEGRGGADGRQVRRHPSCTR
jgi:TolB protein